MGTEPERPISPGTPEDPRLAELLDRFLERLQRGETLDVDGVRRDLPELGPHITSIVSLARDVFAGEEPATGDAQDEGIDATDRPRSFEDYDLIREIGSGGMGTVYLARQKSLDREVALKLLHGAVAFTSRARERFRREARAVARLRHPHIVTLHACGEHEGMQFLAMEHVEGHGLDQCIREASHDPEWERDCIRWVRQIAEALQCAHDHGVIHRDLKPSNIRITGDGRAMLLDFGLAYDPEAEPLSRTGEFHGSPLYASPEQVRGERPTVRSDIYSLGVTLYECLAGQPPFRPGSPEQLFHQILDGNPERLIRLRPELNPEVEVVVLRAMARDPEHRHASAREFANELRAATRAGLPDARPLGARLRFEAMLRRRPVRTLATAIALALAVGIPATAWITGKYAGTARRNEAASLLDQAEAALEDYRASWGQDVELANSYRQRMVQSTRRHEPDRTSLLDLHRQGLRVASREVERHAQRNSIVAAIDAACRLEPTSAIVTRGRRLRAEFALELWREESERHVDAEDVDTRLVAAQRMDQLAAAVREWDDGGHLVAELENRCPLTFQSSPEGTEVFVFRYQSTADGRLAPTPVGVDPDQLLVEPGSLVLRVTRPLPPLREGDLVLELAGHSIEDTVFAVDEESRTWRLARIDGRTIRESFDVAAALDGRAPRQLHQFELVDSEGSITRRRVMSDDAGIEILGAADLAARGGSEALVVTDKGRRRMTLPSGLHVRATAQPLELTPAAVIGRTPCELPDLSAGKYLVVYRPDDGPLLRQLISNRPGDPGVEIRLPDIIESPGPDFALISRTLGGSRGTPLWMGDHEVTCIEYLRFLNADETLAAIGRAPAEMPFVPRLESKGETEPLWSRGSDGRFHLPDGLDGRLPVVGVSWIDARAYTEWLSERARQRGKPFKFRLPKFRDWTQFGDSPGLFVFGDRFLPLWTSSVKSRPDYCLEPVLSYPTDESALGCFDMAGSVHEWLDSSYHGTAQMTVIGGSYAQGAPLMFWTGHQMGNEPDLGYDTVGFRVVAEPREVD